VCSDRNITKIFEITGLDRVFAIYGTRDEAISKLGSVSQPSA
jgi:anti-anti-sigma regulatory factor